MAIGPKKPTTFWILFSLSCFEVISAVPYGLALALEPSGRWVKMSTEMLVGSPFPDFRIPGLILLTVIGLGALTLAMALWRLPGWVWASRLNPWKKRHWTWAGTVAYGVALMIWITTEVIMIGLDSWLQPFHFLIGLAFVLLPLTSSMRRYLMLQEQSVAYPCCGG